MPAEAISPLRRRLIEDMTIRQFSDKTKKDYIRQVKNFSVSAISFRALGRYASYPWCSAWRRSHACWSDGGLRRRIARRRGGRAQVTDVDSKRMVIRVEQGTSPGAALLPPAGGGLLAGDKLHSLTEDRHRAVDFAVSNDHGRHEANDIEVRLRAA
jgi:hypothetical protein